MRLGFIGPAGDDLVALRDATESLLRDANATQAIYLGQDDAVGHVAAELARDIDPDGGTFLDRAVEVAMRGTPDEIVSLLEAADRERLLDRLRVLPPAPARAVEVIEGRIVTMVFDKSVLDEEDIANANLIVYGRSDEPLFKRFGPRYFLTPGPLSKGQLVILESEGDGQVAIGAFDPSGKPLWRELLAQRSTKMQVS
jgi:hypothetical protein